MESGDIGMLHVYQYQGIPDDLMTIQLLHINSKVYYYP